MKFKLGDRISFYIEHALPASILVFVALLQIYLVQTTNLSPWKGGGFGMFAAVDAPSMRIIFAEGLGLDGERLRIDAYSVLPTATIRRIRSFPRESDLAQIGEELLSDAIVPTTIKRQHVIQQLLEDNPNLREIEELPFENILNHQVNTLSDSLYRVRSNYDPDNDALKRSLKAVRLQWWRIRFDRKEKRLAAEPLTPVVEIGEWT
ncbi:MAG: hypothetical protein AB4050_08145 [Synechococcus sp.]